MKGIILSSVEETNLKSKIMQFQNQRRRQDFGSGGGNTLGGRPRRGSLGLNAPEAGKFSKFAKHFFRKLQKILVYVSTKFKNPALIFALSEEKSKFLGKF